VILSKPSDAGVIKSNVGAESSFSIAMNGKAFRVLSDTIYKDKIGSLVREISCNAYDSHVQAGRPDMPFVIHLPDAMEPYFSVTDYGLGLSEDAVRNIFTTYFSSTKENSNDVIGAFGLGSKTPFAYTDTFTVTSTYNGQTVFYSAYLNDDGVPAIAELGRQQTDNHNGVEIKVPVNRGDFVNFRNAVAEQLRFFTVKPEIKNCPGFEFVTPTTPDTLKVSNLTLNRSYHGIYVIQGQVGYPLANANFAEMAKLTPKAREFLSNIQDIGGTLTVPIGKIEVIASREGISYSKVTIDSLNEYLEKASDQVNDAIADRLATATTDWERACVINTNHFFGKFAKMAMNNFTNNAYHAVYGRIDLQLNKAISCYGNQYFYGDSRRPRITGISIVTPNFSTLFIYKNTTKSYVKRINSYIENLADKPQKVYIVNPSVLHSAADISKALGGAKVIAVSDIPEPPKTVAVRGSRSGYKVPEAYSFDATSSNEYSTRTWNRITDFDPTEYDNIVVVKVERSNVENGSAHIYHMRHITRQGNTIIGIRSKEYDRFMKENPEAVSLSSMVERLDREIDKRFTKKRYTKYVLAKEAVDLLGRIGITEDVVNFARKYDISGTNLMNIIQVKNRLSKFVNHFNKEISAWSDLESYTFNKKFFNTLSTGLNGTVYKKNIQNAMEKISKNLGMIQWKCIYGLGNGWDQHTADYIKHFDKVVDG
jgi:hypothetical protein